jgi:hypothetical protein
MKMKEIVKEFAGEFVSYYQNWDGTHSARAITIGKMVNMICHRRYKNEVMEIENNINGFNDVIKWYKDSSYCDGREEFIMDKETFHYEILPQLEKNDETFWWRRN